MAAFLRKYATGTGADVYIPLIKAGSQDFAVGADYTPVAGDVKISIDGAAAVNIGTLPVAVTTGNTALWKFVFTNAELTGQSIMVVISDAATKAIEDQLMILETYGHASAMMQFDLDNANLAVDALFNTATVDPTGIPPVTASLAEKISFLLASVTNKQTFTDATGVRVMRNSADTANIAVATDSDISGVTTRGKSV